MMIKLFFLTLTILTSILTLPTSSQQLISKPGCSSTCANLTIPFPFGTSQECYLDDSFFINCTTLQGTVTPLLRRGDIQVLNISLTGEIKVSAFASSDCYDPQRNYTRLPNYPFTSRLNVSRFPLSSTRNKLTVVGCDTLALVSGSQGRNYTTGCISLCDRVDSVTNGSCSGIGCCQTSIPAGVRNFEIGISSLSNYSRVGNFNPCGYAFVVEEEAYEFSSLDLRNLRGRTRFPVVLDWSVGNTTCEEAKQNQSSYACKATHSECVDAINGPGYLCKCPSGFLGNPYLSDGCQDIDECVLDHPCTNICENSPGTFSCKCPPEYTGDGMEDGTGCTPTAKSQSERSTLVHVALGISIGLLVLVVACSWTYWIMRKRKMMRLREKFFQQNGGFMLKQQLSRNDGATQRARIFTAEDLKKATNNYEDSRIIGQGGYGTVYKGLIQPDNREVAIKKSKISDQSQIEQFINEVVVLSQINHRNVLKLLGCCLETEVPLLVYEFISNGTLSDHLHEKGSDKFKPLSWEMRLKIAAETAEAIAYLHSATSTPIIHRDIKSTNILLDESFTTKVSDFGASKLVPLDHTQLTTLVQGTFGYLDPEYFHSSQLTEKSDVYSFGVLLAELLTGEKALSFERAEKDRNLAMYFVNGVNEDCLFEILDDVLVKEGDYEEIKEVGVLAKGCLRVKGEKRPSMKEVARELERLRSRGNKHPWVEINLNLEETENLLDQNTTFNGFMGDGTDGYGTSVEYDTMRNQVGLATLYDGR